MDHRKGSPLQVIVARCVVVVAAGFACWSILAWSGASLKAPQPVMASRLFDVAQPLNSEARPLPLSDDIQSALKEALALSRDNPLLSYPFVVYAMASYHVGEPQVAERLMQRGLRLDPRNASALSWLFYYYLREDRLADAVDQAAGLYRLEVPDVAPHLSSLLAALLQLPEVENRVTQKLAGTPYLLDILRVGLGNGLDRTLAQKLLDASRSVKSVPGEDQVQMQIFDSFKQAGDFQAAREIRSRSLAVDGKGDVAIYNGSFDRPADEAPFNWQMVNDGNVETEIAPTGMPKPRQGLIGRHFRGHRVTVARQGTLLQPSTYKISFLARALGPAPAHVEAGWKWKVACEGGPELVSLTVAPGSQWQSFAQDFTVPQGCGAQSIELISPSSEKAGGPALQITAVAISR